LRLAFNAFRLNLVETNAQTAEREEHQSTEEPEGDSFCDLCVLREIRFFMSNALSTHAAKTGKPPQAGSESREIQPDLEPA